MGLIRLLSNTLNLPGMMSFRKFGGPVRAAALLADEMRCLDDRGLRAVAAELQGDGALGRTGELGRYLAVASEAARRTLGYAPFDEQLLAGTALLDGCAVEMDTGEGKTLAGALAAGGHALRGRSVHVISVNDYLAQRDAEWMRPFYALLGLEASWIGQQTEHAARREAYRSSIVYAPVSEIGFDVLRDRFAVDGTERVAPVFDVAVVDEADSVMVDEAMTPLVLAGASDDRPDDLTEATRLVEALSPEEHFAIAPDGSTVTLTEAGLDRIEARLGGVNLYASEHLPQLTRVNLALHARVLMHRDVDYLVDDGTIKLISTNRGRIAQLQRWPDGLHAAIEAKERVRTSAPGMILDTITIQDLLLRYRTLSGMSGTVRAVAEDLLEFYSLASGRVERHRANQRVDEPDRISLTAEDRNEALLDEVSARHRTGQPVLIGTQNVAESERLAELLRTSGIEPRVLNAKNDAEEATIVARAGEHGAVTISTQMSGRGTDIRLGGADERDRDRVVAAGGLAVIAVGRYPSRRLDAQLRGRAGRQGDPGSSIALISLDDALVQQYAPEHLLTAVSRQGDHLRPGERRRIVDTAQRIAEGIRRDRHRATWAYNRAIAAQRFDVLEYRHRIVGHDDAALDAVQSRIAALRHPRPHPLLADHLRDRLAVTARLSMLHHLDEHWAQHLAKLQEIRDGIHLRALAGQRPDEEFHRIALHEFRPFFEEVVDATAAFLDALSEHELEHDLDALGLRRPSATWTYMVRDDPFGTPSDRLMGALGKQWRTKVLRVE